MKNINIRNTFAGIFALILCVSFWGCVKDYSPRENPNNGTVTLHLNLDVPGLPTVGSRAMSEAQESAIDYATLQVLLFEVTPGGELFRQKATITQQAPPVITVRVTAAQASQHFRLVLVANMPDTAIADATLKEDALNQYLFNCTGKWDTSSAIPMWGESATTFPVNQDREISMLLHRALARVDVGTLFKFNNPDPATGQEYENGDTDKESVWGLDNFKIKEVYVYRTRNMAYAASDESKMSGNEAVMPNIPSAALFNTDSGTPVSTLQEADDNPLVYTISVPEGEMSYVREIYIPESLVLDAQSSRYNVPCLVVGGYYGNGNTTKVTYYRADFAEYNGRTPTDYLSILRNHRYVFDIRSVSGSGTETPKEALTSTDVKLNLNIVDWNEVPLHFYAIGQYYFDIESRTVTLNAQAPAGATENSKTISYTTDLQLDGSTAPKSMTYEWETGGLFDVAVDYAGGTFTFTALSDNIGPNATPRSDVLTVTVADMQFTIYVTQIASSLEYSIDCASVSVNGKYQEGMTLNATHSISLKVNSATNLEGQSYDIYTVEKNGIAFSAEDTFAAGVYTGSAYEYTVTLQGSGTLVNESGVEPFQTFYVDILTNSMTNSSCTAKIVIGYRTKKILTIGANAAYKYGYMLEPNSASRAFMDASINFGSNSDSRVPMLTNESGNAFTIKVMTAGNGMTGEVINYNDLLTNLNTFQPDIILTGQAVNYFTSGGGTNVIELIKQFVDFGGVFIMCNEYYPNTQSISAMVNAVLSPASAASGNNQSIGTNQVFTLPSGAAYADDPILNGPFGDMRGAKWGADGHEMYGFNGLPPQMIIYSTRTDTRVCMFRHPDKGFFFMGEGGFISNSNRYIGGAYTGSYVYFPFAIDSQYRPIPRTNFTINRDQTISNSQIFGNIIVWAVDYSERLGIQYTPGVDKF